MSSENSDLLITLVLTLLNRADEIGRLITKARDEKEDITDEEMDELGAKDDIARAALDVAIAEAKARRAKREGP